ncbi:MAG TPA: class I SAM-dependent methyltransferase [Candidatus Acidoferrales bacterium]|nr:class I SAM-dependent methyltransferase [Candidatus Acidoferrales bacterium]
MATQAGATKPNPSLVFNTLNAYQNTAALRAAIELDVFTAIGEGTDTSAALAKRCRATERGVRILCDFLVVIGFLTKQDRQYTLTPDSAAFLDRRSPACQASMAGFLTLPGTVTAFMSLGEVIRTGRPALPGEGSLSDENPVWVEFARSMAPMTRAPAEEIARLLNAGEDRKWKVLDIAAGHGTFGIALAQHNPNAEIFAQDWASVLGVAVENARAAGVEARLHLLPGSAFDTDFGIGYNVVLITNFLHHFDPPTIESLLRKVRGALAPDGLVVTLDFVPNEDRVTPPRAAAFAMTMLGTTPSGDAYTFSEYQRMFQRAGFSSNELRPVLVSGHSLILSRV